jgi:PAS domain S-box-containing protein
LLLAAVEDYALILLDSEGHIATWNAGAERLFGYDEAEAAGQPLALIFTEEDRTAGVPEEELRRARLDGCADDVRWHQRKDGSRFWADGVMTLLTDTEGTPRGFCKILRDRTEEKSVTEELQKVTEQVQKEHEKTAVILESISDAFYAVDAAFHFTYVNRKAEQWWGRSRQELVGKHFWTEFPQAVGSETYQKHLQVMQERQPRHYETISPIVKHWVDVTIYPTEDGGLAVYFRDITDRKKTEAALQEALARERRVAHTLQRPLTLTPEPDAFPGLTLATYYEPASPEADIGGDFFDAFSLPRGRVALVVADASGKGLQAAARAIQVKEVLRAFTRESPQNPAHIAARVNDYVQDARHWNRSDSLTEDFVTLVLVILDPLTGEANVVSAAAEPPLVLRASGKIDIPETPAGATGLPLGVLPGEPYHAVPFRLGHGETILLTTDGLTEARQGRTQFLGLAGLAERAQEALQMAPSLSDAARAIVESARQFGRGRFRDDVCLLMVRRH